MKPMIDYDKISTPVEGELDDILAQCRANRKRREIMQVLPKLRREMYDLDDEKMMDRDDRYQHHLEKIGYQS